MSVLFLVETSLSFSHGEGRKEVVYGMRSNLLSLAPVSAIFPYIDVVPCSHRLHAPRGLVGVTSTFSSGLSVLEPSSPLLVPIPTLIHVVSLTRFQSTEYPSSHIGYLKVLLVTTEIRLESLKVCSHSEFLRTPRGLVQALRLLSINTSSRCVRRPNSHCDSL